MIEASSALSSTDLTLIRIEEHALYKSNSKCQIQLSLNPLNTVPLLRYELTV